MAAPIALVTGATRGIGRCGALSLARRGYDLIITGRTMREGEGRIGDVALPGSLEKTSQEITALGRRALPLRMDITQRQSVAEAWREAIDTWGHVDVLVNNAPYSGPGTDARVLEIDLDCAAQIVAANYLHPLQLTQLALPGMLSRGGGCIINLGSGSALVPPPAAAGEGGWSLAYCASKAAFHQIATVVDVEYRARGIRAFTMEPGYTITEKHRALDRGDLFSQGFHGDPPEVAGEVIGWLASEPEAERFLGKMVHAQALCARYELVPGWSPERAR